ncbi:MAG: sigma-70 family RNA polymerase sigma factor [Vicinamibacterales bacterium]
MSSTDSYSEHSETIEAVLAFVSRRHRLAPDDGDEFSSWARLRLIADECAVLRKFRGTSSLRTYLISVVLHLFQDWRNAQWGRWRPSAQARTLGPVAVELEKLVSRDGRDYEEAVETLVTTGQAKSRHECDEVWARLPRRGSRRFTDPDVLDDVPAPAGSTDWLGFDDPHELATRASEALAQALRGLPPQEQLIIRLRYLDGFTVPRIADAIGGEQKPYYRRIEQIHEKLGASMMAAGVTVEELHALFSNPEAELGEILAAELGKLRVGPSTSSNAGGGA